MCVCVLYRKICILWKLEGDINISEGGNNICIRMTGYRARAQEDLLHSQRRSARIQHAIEKNQLDLNESFPASIQNTILFRLKIPLLNDPNTFFTLLLSTLCRILIY